MRPILFQLGPIPVHAYGTFLVFGFLIGLWRATKVCEKRGIPSSQVVDACVLMLISGIIGCRLLYLLLAVPHAGWGIFAEAGKIWQGGLSFHGGLVTSIACLAVYVRAKRLDFLKFADLLAPSAAIGYAFARIGCFLNGCCYGVHTDLPWGVRFTDASGALTDPRHPAQLYAFVISLVIFALLTRIERLKRPRGFVFFSYLVLYSVYRFGIEFIRKGATAEVWFWGLTQAQVASIAAVVVFGVILMILARKPLQKAA